MQCIEKEVLSLSTIQLMDVLIEDTPVRIVGAASRWGFCAMQCSRFAYDIARSIYTICQVSASVPR